MEASNLYKPLDGLQKHYGTNIQLKPYMQNSADL